MKSGLKKKLFLCGFAATLVFLGFASLIAETKEGDSGNGKPISTNRTAKPVLEEIALSGQITNVLTGESVSDADLKVWEYLGDGEVGDLLGEYKTGSDGFYNKSSSVEPNSWGRVKLLLKDLVVRKKPITTDWVKIEITHPDYYDPAVRYFNLGEGEEFDANIIPVHDVEVYDNRLWEIEEIDFMELANWRVRSPPFAEKPFERWVKPPKWYIDTNPAYGSGVEVTRDKIDLVYEIIQNELVDFTNGFFDNPYIEEGINPPKGIGWVTVKWKDLGVIGYHAEFIDGNEIVAGVVGFWTLSKERETYLQELTQVSGLTSEMERKTVWDKEGYYIDSAFELGKWIYSRPLGNMNPDIDSAPF